MFLAATLFNCTKNLVCLQKCGSQELSELLKKKVLLPLHWLSSFTRYTLCTNKKQSPRKNAVFQSW